MEDSTALINWPQYRHSSISLRLFCDRHTHTHRTTQTTQKFDSFGLTEPFCRRLADGDERWWWTNKRIFRLFSKKLLLPLALVVVFAFRRGGHNNNDRRPCAHSMNCSTVVKTFRNCVNTEAFLQWIQQTNRTASDEDKQEKINVRQKIGFSHITHYYISIKFILFRP